MCRRCGREFVTHSPNCIHCATCAREIRNEKSRLFSHNRAEIERAQRNLDTKIDVALDGRPWVIVALPPEEDLYRVGASFCALDLRYTQWPAGTVFQNRFTGIKKIIRKRGKNEECGITKRRALVILEKLP